jgi:hypothetical protein
MAFAADDFVANLIRRVCRMWPAFVGKAIGSILLVASVICVNSRLSAEIQRSIRLGHERAINWHLVQVGTNAVVLRVPVEKHPEL